MIIMPEDLKDIEASILAGQKAGTEHSEQTEPDQAPPAPDATEASEVAKLRAQLEAKEAELATFRTQVAQRNVEFDKQIAELKEREEEMRQVIAEVKASRDPPASQLSTADEKRAKYEEVLNTPEFADFLILRIAANRRDRTEPGFAKNLFAQVRAEEKKAGMLAGYTIRPEVG